MTDTELNQPNCPPCHGALSESDQAVIEQYARRVLGSGVNFTAGDFGMSQPFPVACGHHVDLQVNPPRLATIST